MSRTPHIALALLAGLAVSAAPAAQVQEAVFEIASTPVATNRLGWSVDVSGIYAVATSPGQHDGMTGYLYVYRRGGSSWIQEQVFKGASTDAGDWLGIDVAIDGDVIVGGGYGVSDGPDGTPGYHRGAAWVFRRVGGTTPWVEEARLQPATLLEHDGFGRAVGVSGGLIVAGATGVDERGDESGAAYVFRYSAGAWSEETRLTAIDGGPHQRFGSAVAASGDTLAIGAEGTAEADSFSGAVYVYRFDGATWSLEQRLSTTGGARDDRFGAALDLAGDVLVVGAPRELAAGQAKAGRVHVYRRSGSVWSEEAALQAPTPRTADNFGGSVSLSSDQLLAGVQGDDGLGPSAGRACHFRRTGGVWSLHGTFTGSSVDSADGFGHSVAIDGDLAIVGAPHAIIEAVARYGRAYVFSGLLGGAP
jgi:hypothetical protein